MLDCHIKLNIRYSFLQTTLWRSSFSCLFSTFFFKWVHLAIIWKAFSMPYSHITFWELLTFTISIVYFHLKPWLCFLQCGSALNRLKHWWRFLVTGPDVLKVPVFSWLTAGFGRCLFIIISSYAVFSNLIWTHPLMVFHTKWFQCSAEIRASPAKGKRECLAQDLLYNSRFGAFCSSSILEFYS